MDKPDDIKQEILKEFDEKYIKPLEQARREADVNLVRTDNKEKYIQDLNLLKEALIRNREHRQFLEKSINRIREDERERIKKFILMFSVPNIQGDLVIKKEALNDIINSLTTK